MRTKKYWKSKRFWLLITSMISCLVMAGTFDFSAPLINLGIPALIVGRISGAISLLSLIGTLALQFRNQLKTLSSKDEQ
jgi:hypothetical protein